METLIQEIKTQIEFYSDRFEIYGRKDDKAQLGYYREWLKEIENNS